MGLLTSAVINSITTTQCLVCLSTASAILHCYCVECVSLTGALKILMEMDSVTIQWVRQETLIVPHLKEGKLEEFLSYQPSHMSLCTEECLLCNLLLLIVIYFNTIWLYVVHSAAKLILHIFK